MKIKRYFSAVIGAVALYLLFSFVEADIDCMNWGVWARLWFVFGVFFICATTFDVK